MKKLYSILIIVSFALSQSIFSNQGNWIKSTAQGVSLDGNVLSGSAYSMKNRINYLYM